MGALPYFVNILFQFQMSFYFAFMHTIRTYTHAYIYATQYNQRALPSQWFSKFSAAIVYPGFNSDYVHLAVLEDLFYIRIW